ncbi:MAG: hypothetical protein JO352_07340 [Chloroflexi bacterium]|nr:hypothetical protein [Chloroflexota bacterium]
MNTAVYIESVGTGFGGIVLEIQHEWGSDYDVQCGGWGSQPEETWLSEHVLAPYKNRRVRVTIEELESG